MMLDLRNEEQQQRMAILTAAANLSGHLLRYQMQLSEEEERALVEALSLAGPNSLLKELMDFMDHLPPPKKGAETAGSSSTLPSSPPQLYSLRLGNIQGDDLNRSATAAVVDALSRSRIPFFDIIQFGEYRMNNPAIEAQVKRNRRNVLLRLNSTRVAATSMRLFICGDPFAGKTTLISTMRSMYGTRKRDKFMRPLFATQGRTRGIEVAAIQRAGIRVSLWDMAGQSEFHAFHDCMFPDIGTSSYQLPSMFMFVWSPIDSKSREKGAVKNEKNLEASFRYWLRFLASKSRQSNIALRVIVVFTRADQVATLSHAFTIVFSLRKKMQTRLATNNNEMNNARFTWKTLFSGKNHGNRIFY